MATHVRFISLVFLFASLLGCGSNDPQVPGGTGTSTIWDVTLGSTLSLAPITAQSAEPRGDGGVRMKAVGTVNTEPMEFTIEIAGGTAVVLSAPVPVSKSGINVRLAIGSAVYRGTSGSMTFTAYDATVDKPIAASLDINFVSLVTGPAGSIKGTFSATISNPSPTP